MVGLKVLMEYTLFDKKLRSGSSPESFLAFLKKYYRVLKVS